MSEQKELVDNYHKLEDDNVNLKKELDLKNSLIEREKNKYKGVINSMEKHYKSIISDLEEHNHKLNTELINIDNDKVQLLKEISNDNQSKNILFNELEKVQNSLKSLEETKEKSEGILKSQINHYNDEIIEYDRQLHHYKEIKHELEIEIAELKSLNIKKSNEINEKSKKELQTVGVEIGVLKNVISVFEKEKNDLKNELEMSKVNSEKTKIEYKELNEKMKKIKEEYEFQNKKWEERILTKEKNFDAEKNKLLSQIELFTLKIKELEKIHKESKENVTIEQVSDSEKIKINLRKKNSLDQALDSFNDEKNFGSIKKIIELQNENKILEQKILDITSILLTKNYCVSELEILKVENNKLKQDIRDLTDMYESQILSLQQECKNYNEICQNNISDNIAKILLDNKFYHEKIEIMNNELNQTKILFENDLKFLKNQLYESEQETISTKVSLACQAFEKDSQIIKLKKVIRKYTNRSSTMSIF